MRVGTLVMLINNEPGLPPIGTCGEIVEGFDGEDYGVDFPHYVAEAGPEPYFYAPPEFLLPIGSRQPETKIIIKEALPA